MIRGTSSSWWQRHHIHLLLALIVALSAVLRFFAIGVKTVWLDEAFSIWVARHSLWEGWAWLIQIDQHPPLYYSLLTVWQWLFGDLQGTVRALSALFSTLAVPGLFLVGRRLSGDAYVGLLAALILAVAPFHVRFAQETRMYALLSCVAVYAIFFAVSVLQIDRRRTLTLRDWVSPGTWRRVPLVGNAVGLAVLQAAVMLTHNTAAVFFVLALNLSVLGTLFYRRITGRRVTMPAVNQAPFPRNWLATQLAALLLWSPWAIPFVIQSIRVDGEFWIWPPTLLEVGNAIRNFNFAHFPDWLPAAPLMLLYGLLAGLGLWALRRRLAWGLFLVSLCLTPFLGELLVSLRRPIFYDRTLIWTNLAYYLLIALGIRSLGAGPFRHGRNLAAQGTRYGYVPVVSPYRLPRTVAVAVQVALVLVIMAASAVSLNGYYFHFEKEDWAKAAEFVARQAQPGDMILFNASWVQIPFEYYYRHYGLDTELRGAPTDLFDRQVLEPKMTSADMGYLHNLVAGHPRVWLVYSHDWYTDPEQIIPSELDRHMQRMDDREFVGLRILRYDARR